MTIECTNLDHSDYKIGTNHWGLERWRDVESCSKCKRPSLDFWLKSLEWQNRDRAYWKQIFKDACEQKVFFFKATPRDGHGGDAFGTRVYADADTVNDPASLLRPTRPLWLKHDLVVEIKQQRYRRRLSDTKSHHYGFYQPSIDREIQKMMSKLDYVDNTRFAALNNRKDMRRYRNSKESGCCGSFDKVVIIYGKKFMIGCNHGH